MSLANLNVKMVKGKQKTLPKLKTILANPYKSECASLDVLELQTFKELLLEEITKSDLEPRAFATAGRICIGLESVLRAINNSRCSCIFISVGIKPKHVVHLIARNTEVKNPTAPVYLVSELEILTDQIFGVRALAFAFPVVTDRFGSKLQEWIAARQKIVKAKQPQPKTTTTKRKISAQRQLVSLTEEKKELKTYDKIIEEPKQKTRSGDFISFSSSSHNVEISTLNLDADKNELFGALSQMTTIVVGANSAICTEKTEPIEHTVVETKNDSEPIYFETDDFLQDYQPLEVHKIRPNPNKKTKKKRQKSKKFTLRK